MEGFDPNGLVEAYAYANEQARLYLDTWFAQGLG
jgi:hypothetical protein